MAEYTIELGSLVKAGYPLALNTYPIYDENHRQELNDKIIRHYWFDEIGMETPDRFNHYLESRMLEIMPYYNQLYESAAIRYNPLLTDTFEQVTDTAARTARQQGRQSVRNEGQRSDEAATKYTNDTSQKDFTHEHQEDKASGYGKSGDHGIDQVGKETQDLDMDSTYHNTEKTDITDETTGSHDLTEDTTKDTTGKKTDKSKTVVDRDTTSDTTTNMNRTETYSDFPQTAITVTTTTAPDGTVTTTSSGYATTQTTTNQTETVKSKGTEDVTTTYDNTTDTTENVVGNRKLNENTHQTDTRDATVDDDSTAHESNDNTFDTTHHEDKQWREGGSETYHLDNGAEEHTGIRATGKTNDQKQTRRDSSSLYTGTESMSSTNDIGIVRKEQGRRGQSPAKLVAEYRATILNIDVQIIQALHDLFMEVY